MVLLAIRGRVLRESRGAARPVSDSKSTPAVVSAADRRRVWFFNRNCSFRPSGEICWGYQQPRVLRGLQLAVAAFSRSTLDPWPLR